MPIYEYCCQDCKQIFEEWQEGFEEKQLTCPVCSGPATRIISHSAFILKGSGWYVTDYAGQKSGVNGNGNGSSSEDKDSGTKADSAADTPAPAKTEPADTAKSKVPDQKSTG
jgi:putative FmdB family regulatory protein